MKNTIKSIIAIILVVLGLAIWLFPVIIAFATSNWWYILLYLAWWGPAIIFSIMIGAVLNEL